MVTKIDYIELATGQMAKSQRFFADAFGWAYNDYGRDYQEIANAGVSGGLSADDSGTVPLIILRTDGLDASLEAVKKAGGEILKPIFEFPGGRRFHFREPGGNELAVWCTT